MLRNIDCFVKKRQRLSTSEHRKKHMGRQTFLEVSFGEDRGGGESGEKLQPPEATRRSKGVIFS